MDTVDKLTLELFTNKTNYRKYLSKSDPERFHLLEEKERNIRNIKEIFWKKQKKYYLFRI